MAAEGQTCHAAAVVRIVDEYHRQWDVDLAVFHPDGGIVRKSDVEYREQEICPTNFWTAKYDSWHWPHIPEEN